MTECPYSVNIHVIELVGHCGRQGEEKEWVKDDFHVSTLEINEIGNSGIWKDSREEMMNLPLN